MPVSWPLSAGMQSVTAFAAPVLAGMMFGVGVAAAAPVLLARPVLRRLRRGDGVHRRHQALVEAEARRG